MRSLAALLAALTLAAAQAALACTVPAGWRAPTNLELAADANLIVLGEVTGAAELTRDGAPVPAIAVRPLAALKGLMPGETVLLPGMSISRDSRVGDPLAFDTPHPEALSGACIRRSFSTGATVLFFLRRADGQWVPAGDAFSRWAEDVSGPDAPWVQLAELYVQAARLEPGERATLLADQLEALQARIDAGGPDRDVAQAFAADIERSMAAPGFPRFAERAPLPPPPADDLGELGARIDALADD